jgi:hypothetical protein
MSRRRVLAGATAGVAAPAILHWPANAAEFTYKCGGALPDGHPMAIRAREAMALIKEDSGGRLDITLYTNSVLGGDTAMISQTIAGALEMYTLPLDLLAAKNPACGNYDANNSGDDGNYNGDARACAQPFADNIDVHRVGSIRHPSDTSPRAGRHMVASE